MSWPYQEPIENGRFVDWWWGQPGSPVLDALSEGARCVASAQQSSHATTRAPTEPLAPLEDRSRDRWWVQWRPRGRLSAHPTAVSVRSSSPCAVSLSPSVRRGLPTYAQSPAMRWPVGSFAVSDTRCHHCLAAGSGSRRYSTVWSNNRQQAWMRACVCSQAPPKSRHGALDGMWSNKAQRYEHSMASRWALTNGKVKNCRAQDKKHI